MKEPGGYIYLPRSWPEDGEDCSHEFPVPSRHITEAVTGNHRPMDSVSVSLISCDGTHLHYASIVERGPKMTSSQWRLTFSMFVSLIPLPTFTELRLHVSAAEYSHISKSFAEANSFAVSPDGWKEVLIAMKKLSPESAHSIERLEKIVVERRRRRIASPGYEVMAQELDAISTALWIAGFDKRKELHERTLADPSPAPVVTLLGGAPMREDEMIEFDKGLITPGWREILKNQVGGVAFENPDGNRLTVMNVNRTSVERATGVDLVYVNHAYKSFVMVQYKRMIKEVRGGEWGFRPDAQFAAELARMEALTSTWETSGVVSEPSEYRLHAGPFYFKLVPSVTWEPFATKPLSGMYLPLDYWQVLQNFSATQGPRGGPYVTFDNVGRHITTTHFVSLMQRGWIGSHVALFQEIASLILTHLNGNNSIVLAVGHARAA